LLCCILWMARNHLASVYIRPKKYSKTLELLRMVNRCGRVTIAFRMNENPNHETHHDCLPVPY
jgi:hypothetical protein